MTINWVIAGKNDSNDSHEIFPEVGKIYEIRDVRKGNFIGKIIEVNGSFATVEIVEGEIHWVSKENQLFNPNPEVVNIRDSLVYLVEYRR